MVLMPMFAPPVSVTLSSSELRLLTTWPEAICAAVETTLIGERGALGADFNDGKETKGDDVELFHNVYGLRRSCCHGRHVGLGCSELYKFVTSTHCTQSEKTQRNCRCVCCG